MKKKQMKKMEKKSAKENKEIYGTQNKIEFQLFSILRQICVSSVATLFNFGHSLSKRLI
jgi:hypothetical protein